METSELIKKIEALESRASDFVEKANAPDATAEDVKSFKATLENEIMPEIKLLQAQRETEEHRAATKALASEVTTLKDVLDDLRGPGANSGFSVGIKSASTSTIDASDNPYAEGGRSFYNDVKMAGKGFNAAQTRLAEVAARIEGKTMSEGDPVQGGYFVQPAIERQIVEALELDNVVRGLASKVNVTTNEIQLDQLSVGTMASWVAELQEKPELTSTALVSIAAGVFTAAGLASVSNQLLADSNPQIDTLLTADLAKRLVALEETAFLDGDGSGKPTGILRTSGVQTQSITDTTVTAAGGLLDSILDAIGKVQTEHGEPTAILMHPRTWTRILKAKDAQGVYTVGSPSVQDARTATKTLFGYKVVTTNRMPTNLGSGTNESRVIVGDFSEALILDRQGITVDESIHVGFTRNVTYFRAEQRVGFTAARAPKAFCVVGGVGLANG